MVHVVNPQHQASALPPLILALLEPAAYPHPVGQVRLIETHISWVLLAGEFAYKIKKPLDLGFLDFSTLARRRFCCEEEIRLNGRLAPTIYLGVAAIVDTPAGPRVVPEAPAGTADVREWAVRMRAFPADATLDREPAVGAEQLDAVAERIARFHGEIDAAPTESDLGEPGTVMQPVRENFSQLRQLLARPGLAAGREEMGAALARVEAWSEGEFTRLAGFFAARKRAGFVRECHGDLHLGNIAWVDDAPLIFDCIEFNPRLRFVDVLSECAFLFMDLASRGRDDLAWRFLNCYLDRRGDHGGLAGFRFYLVYRAMVRAKVDAIRADQGDTEAAKAALAYLHLAERLAERPRPALLLMHGLSGSGKSWLSQRLLEQLGAIRLRSDVERKRLFGAAPAPQDGTARPPPPETPVASGIYAPAASQLTFQHLEEVAASLLAEGYPVIVDATFLLAAVRAPFHALAARLGCPFRIVSLQADVAVLRQRIRARRQRGDDASEAGLAVLEAQMRSLEPLTGAEQALSTAFDFADQARWPALLDRLCTDLGKPADPEPS